MSGGSSLTQAEEERDKKWKRASLQARRGRQWFRFCCADVSRALFVTILAYIMLLQPTCGGRDYVSARNQLPWSASVFLSLWYSANDDWALMKARTKTILFRPDGHREKKLPDWLASF